MDLVILADDFTGASDAAAPFAASRRTLVVLSATASRAVWDSKREPVDVLSVDLDLRESSDADAGHKMDAAIREACSSSRESRVFVKIDSTLRGPIGGLVSGALSGSGKDVAVLAPAFPEQGRLLDAGRVVVDGEPGASLTLLLNLEGTALLGANFARSAVEVERAVDHARELGARRVVVDADSSECLASVAVAWRRHPDWLLVGSGGLARQVAGPSTAEQAFDLPGGSGPVLVVAGSPTPMTAAQIDRLRAIGSVTTLAAASDVPIRPPEHGLVVLCTPPASERDTGAWADAIAATVVEWSQCLRPRAIVLAGGATARCVFERLGAVGVRVSGELSPGVPIGRLVGGVWDQLLVVTKAGGFGHPNTLLDVVQFVGVLSSGG